MRYSNAPIGTDLRAFMCFFSVSFRTFANHINQLSLAVLLCHVPFHSITLNKPAVDNRNYLGVLTRNSVSKMPVSPLFCAQPKVIMTTQQHLYVLLYYRPERCVWARSMRTCARGCLDSRQVAGLYFRTSHINMRSQTSLMGLALRAQVNVRKNIPDI